MKRIIVTVILAGFAVSCGPRRLGCGPGRCDNSKPQPLTERNIRNV
ncbi:hypothetical protein [Flavobacterium suncheonense]|nr:hypothetical protein [Flavobacterium suncheonense]